MCNCDGVRCPSIVVRLSLPGCAAYLPYLAPTLRGTQLRFSSQANRIAGKSSLFAAQGALGVGQQVHAKPGTRFLVHAQRKMIDGDSSAYSQQLGQESRVNQNAGQVK